MFLLMFAERCFSGIVHNLLKTIPARGVIIFRWLGECIVHFLQQTLRVAGVSQFACVLLYGFHSSFLIVFLLILKMTLDLNIWWSVPQVAPRIIRLLQMSILSRYLVVMKYSICPCRERGGGVQVDLSASFSLNMVLVTIRLNSVHSANRSSPLELHSPIPYLIKAEGHLSFPFPILALKSPISRSLSALGMFLTV